MLDMVTATNFSIPFTIDALTDALAERSKAVAQGAIPQGRGLEPHSCQFGQSPTRAGEMAPLRADLAAR